MFNKIGWLINDKRRCIKGTKTWWDWIYETVPGMVDKCYDNFDILASYIEEQLKKEQPDYILRNGTYFRKIKTSVKTISLLQDIKLDDTVQHQVLNDSDVVVANSIHTANLYKCIITSPVKIIPLGVDANLFKPGPNCSSELGIPPNAILFVGASTSIKGISMLETIIENTNYNFVLVMKDGSLTNHPRIKIFNKVNEDLIVKIYNSCSLLLCTSEQETQHLAGMQAMACNMPIISTKVGIYNEIANDVNWGLIANNFEEFVKAIRMVFQYLNYFKPREFFLEKGFGMDVCMNRWKTLIKEITHD